MIRTTTRRIPRHSILAALATGLTLALTSGQWSSAQDNGADDPLLAQALAELAGDIGVWNSRWEQLDAEGNVVSEFTGTETGRYAIGDRVVEITTEIPEVDHISKSLRFYNPITKRIEFSSVDQRGVHWFMHAEVGSDVMTSDLHLLPGGRQMMIRFIVVEEKEGWMLVHREDSLDEGETWRLGARQYRTLKED